MVRSPHSVLFQVAVRHTPAGANLIHVGRAAWRLGWLPSNEVTRGAWSGASGARPSYEMLTLQQQL